MFFKDDDFESPGLVQEVPKTKLHYTITPIGGPEALALYMEAKAEAEEKWQAEQAVWREKAHANAIKVVAEERAAMDPSYEETKETAYLDKYISVRRATQKERSACVDAFKPYQKPRLTVFEKVKGAISLIFFK